MLRPWLQLLRAALAPSILWDLVAGALLAGHAPGPAWFPPILAGLLLYHAGMVLNDVADLPRDLADRPSRPLPAGRVRPGAALALGLGLLAGGLLVLFVLAPDLLPVGLPLAAAIILYDFGGPGLRRQLGPGLLAASRAAALLLGMLGPGAPPRARTPLLVAACGAQALYWLFLSRLATHEERGCQGMRALPFLLLAGVAPLVLLRHGLSMPSLVFAGAWLPLPLWLLLPSWRLRHGHWSPPLVQAAVRRALTAGPWIPGLALLAGGQPSGLAGAAAAILLVHLLARLLPPE